MENLYIQYSPNWTDLFPVPDLASVSLRPLALLAFGLAPLPPALGCDGEDTVMVGIPGLKFKVIISFRNYGFLLL